MDLKEMSRLSQKSSPDRAKKARASKAAERFELELIARNIHVFCKEAVRRHKATVPEIYGRSRLKHVVAARVEVWRYLRAQGWSYGAIGKLFNRTHATVLLGIRWHENKEKETDAGEDRNQK